MAARAKTETAQTGQLNVRLSPELADALDAIAYVYEISPPEYLRQLLSADVLRRSNEDSLFNQALRLRTEARLQRRGDVHVLPHSGEVS